MKQVSSFILLAFFLFTVSAFGQILEMTPDQISQARIKSAIISSSQPGAARKADEQPKREAYTFDRTGYLVGRITYNEDDTPGTSAIFRYDEHGNRIFHEITIYADRITPNVAYQYQYENGRIKTEANNNTALTRHYFYDDYGQLIREELRDGKAYTVETIRYAYDDAGSLITEISDQEFISRKTSWEYDVEGNMIERTKISSYTFENARSSYSCEKFTYDGEGRIMHSMRVDASGKILTYLNYAYDAAGQLISKSSGKVDYRYTYDDQGMLSSRRKMVAGKMVEDISYDYRYYDPIQESKVASQK